MAEETTKKDNIDVNDPFSDKGMFAIDKGLGAVMGAKGVKGVDTSNIDKAISGIEKPASGSVYDKLAARYRSQGAGAVLRTQKNLANLFLPTINLIQEREADALARYTLLKQGLEDFDDSTIFGQADGSEMPIVDEIKSLANMTKEDMRELSRLNPADERYDVLAKKIQKNNEAIAKFDEINQKLLEIRNSQDGSADASQWSKGMTQTEINMWMDIYTGKGNNIKIQDGKLVWTDTRANIGEGPKVIEDMMSSTELGKTTNVIEGLSEHFEGDGSGRYENLSNMSLRTSSKTSYPYTSGSFDDGGTTWVAKDDPNNNDLILTQKEYDNLPQNEKNDYIQMKDVSKGKNYQKAINKNKQRFLINLGYLDKTNADGSSAIDGVFGKNSKDAERRYLEDRAKLVEESKNKYSKTKEAAKTASGKTKVIDLNNISGGPTMIQNDATIVERKIQGGVQDLINSGVDITDPNYQRTVKSMIYQLNQTGPAGIKSLIFDGLNTDDDDIFTSENTNSFIEGVIANNAEEFGIENPENMTEQELESAIEKLKEGDVTIQYDNGKGKKLSLQRQFLEWYKGQIDAKVEAGVKSKFSTTTGKVINDNNKKGKDNNKKGKDKNTDPQDPETPTTSFNFQESITSGEGGNKDSFTLPPITSSHTGQEKQYENSEIYFKNGVGYIKIDDSGSAGSVSSFDGNVTGLINYLNVLYPDAERSEIADYVNEQVSISKKRFDMATKEINSDIYNTGGEEKYGVKDRDANYRINLLREKQITWGYDDDKQYKDDYLLTYGNDEDVLKALNSEYGDIGFTFLYDDNDESALLSDIDGLTVEHENFPGRKFYVRFDTMTETQDLKRTENLISIMKGLYNNNLDAVIQGDFTDPYKK